MVDAATARASATGAGVPAAVEEIAAGVVLRAAAATGAEVLVAAVVTAVRADNVRNSLTPSPPFPRLPAAEALAFFAFLVRTRGLSRNACWSLPPIGNLGEPPGRPLPMPRA